MNQARLELLKKYLKEDPEDPFNLYAIATEYLKESPESARQYFDQLLEQHADYLPTYYHAAQLLSDLEEVQKAREIYEKGIALAQRTGQTKTLRELENAYQNFQFEWEE